MHMSAAASAGPAKTTSALSDSILGAQHSLSTDGGTLQIHYFTLCLRTRGRAEKELAR